MRQLQEEAARDCVDESDASAAAVVARFHGRRARLEAQWSALEAALDELRVDAARAYRTSISALLHERARLLDELRAAIAASGEASDAEELSENVDVSRSCCSKMRAARKKCFLNCAAIFCFCRIWNVCLRRPARLQTATAAAAAPTRSRLPRRQPTFSTTRCLSANSSVCVRFARSLSRRRAIAASCTKGWRRRRRRSASTSLEHKRASFSAISRCEYFESALCAFHTW